MGAVSGARIGTAGWALPRDWRDRFPAGDSNLERYAGRFAAVEINSSFYRQHRRRVYERWASSVPQGFQFAVKLPRAITHDQALVASDVLLEVFLEEVTGLGDRLGPLLVQLPPSLDFHADLVAEFLEVLRARHHGLVACEPRHAGWFTPAAEAVLRSYRVARVAADPARVPAAAEPGGWPGLIYYRLHGSPRIYYSDYDDQHLAALAGELERRDGGRTEQWCIFDNTTLGFATRNALELSRRLAPRSPAPDE